MVGRRTFSHRYVPYLALVSVDDKPQQQKKHADH